MIFHDKATCFSRKEVSTLKVCVERNERNIDTSMQIHYPMWVKLKWKHYSIKATGANLLYDTGHISLWYNAMPTWLIFSKIFTKDTPQLAREVLWGAFYDSEI